MELVWYRMLTPLLGGTTFTFGLILAIALVGIGLGSAAYSLGRRELQPTLTAFALTCSLEAFFIGLPYALGDRLAILALMIRPLGTIGFIGYVFGWVLVTALVLLPAAFIAGLQFPLLIGLLGRGRQALGKNVGQAYAWNTIGAIIGSIAGGFGLLPLLDAIGAWKLVVLVLASLSVVAIFLSYRRRRFLVPVLVVLVTASGACALLLSRGPTAAWRHTPIGAGRADQMVTGLNSLKNFINGRRRSIAWEKEGVESSVALSRNDGYAFLVNGKSDGHARFDAGTQVMGGLLGAILHPNPRNGLVIGLGTGSTVGWLAAVPSIERVDVVEIEPAIRQVAEDCALVNHDALRNPKVHLYMGDGREFVLAGRQQYDLISSEPSNPYRAGIASLLTTDFYRAASRRLRDNGIFLQFLQAYEIDARTLRIIYASVHSVFPYVETYETRRGDLLLVATKDPLVYDVETVRARLSQEPARTALARVWRVRDLEGFLAHYVAGPGTAAALARGMPLNTDDQTVVEYAFARTLGDQTSFDVSDLRRFARDRSDDLPDVKGGSIDLTNVQDQRLSMIAAEGVRPTFERTLSPDQIARAQAHFAYLRGDYKAVVNSWVSQDRPPRDPTEVLTFAEAIADTGDERALLYMEPMREFHPVEADVVLARMRWRQGQFTEAADALTSAFVRYRNDPWPLPTTMSRALDLPLLVGRHDPALARKLHQAISQPFSVRMLDEQRELTLLGLASVIDQGSCSALTLEALKPFEPDIPWYPAFLQNRAACYERAHHPLAARARKDLEDYLKGSPQPLAGDDPKEKGREPARAPLIEN